MNKSLVIITSFLLISSHAVSGDFDGYCRAQYNVFSRDNRKLYLDVGGQEGPIKMVNVGAGVIFPGNVFLMVSYGQFHQEYFGDYIVPFCRDCNIFFQQAYLGAGIEFFRDISKKSGFFLDPHMMLGAEFVPNRGLIDNEELKYLLNPVFKPQINLGFYFLKLDFYIGLNYTVWLPRAMSMNREGLYDDTTGDPLLWDRDLFPGRKGFGFVSGLRFTFY